MKKGFTLIELLSVIVILAIVLAIAIPSINNVIENSKINALKDSEKMLIKAIENYLTAGKTNYPENIGDVIEIKLSTLQDDNYIGEIESPYNKSNECNGYVNVIKIDKGNYEYIPYLNCVNDIGSSSEDELVLHYTFDDFQEPTVNLIDDTIYEMNNISYDYIGMENEYKKYAISGTWSSGSYPYSFHLKSYDYLEGLSYSVSCYLYTNVPNKFTSDFGRINVVNDANLSGERRVIRNGNYTAREDYIHSVNMNNRPYVISRPISDGTTFNPNTDFLYIKNIQVEQKSYSTPYTNTVRTGLTKDCSSTGNHATLELNTTPKWVEDAKIGNGAYKFDGIAKYIDCGNNSSLNLINAGTISLWAKTDLLYPSFDSSYRYRGLVSKTLSGSGSGISYWIDWWGTNNSRKLRAGLGNGTISESINFSFDWENKWRYIIFTWNGSNLYLYVDGELIDQKPQTINVQILDKTVEIGRTFNTNNYTWDGLIDDVRIYNRALTNDEIKINYESNK